MKQLATSLGLGLAACLVFGCEKDEIRSYQVPRVNTPRREVPSEAPKREVRMLAAILPHGDRTWYFKLTGAPLEIETRKVEFRRFVESSRFAEGGEQPLTWTTIPEGWRREAGSDLRYATFRIDSGNGSLELTVTPLGRGSGSVLSNINRWRDQLGLRPVGEADLPKLVEEGKVGDAMAQFADFTGTISGEGSKMPPFASRRETGSRMMEGARANSPTYQKPAGWKVKAPTVMSVANFQVDDGAQSAEVTITPLAGQAGGLAANVNRWRAQIGLGEVSEEQILKDLRQIDASGALAKYTDLVGPDSAGAQRQRILAAVIERGATTWFVKIKGNADLVGKEKPNFEAFIKSMKFD
jgi:hypothetical protein